jgi:DNA end-binding protein Ku
MPQAVWTGDLSFGLVNIPIKLYGATAPRRVRFHHYEAGTGRRIRYARVATGPPPERGDVTTTGEVPAPPEDRTPEVPAEDGGPATPAPAADDRAPPEWPPREPAVDAEEAEVPWEEVVRGFEIEPGRVVTVTPEELEAVAPERSRLLEVEQFVPLHDIDPVFFDKTYYVVPAGGRGTERPYWLLYRAMEAAGRVAIGRFVMRTKEYLAAVRPAEHVLVLETLFYADEVRDAKEVWHPLVAEPPERELRMAHNLVDAMTGEWEPERHRDAHRERLLELLRSKAGDALAVPEPEEAPTESVIDLMAALEASVEAAKQARAGDQRS